MTYVPECNYYYANFLQLELRNFYAGLDTQIWRDICDSAIIMTQNLRKLGYAIFTLILRRKYGVTFVTVQLSSRKFSAI